jgi:predicted ATPase
MPTLHVRNFYALRSVDWSLPEICVLTGANGAGKTTVLLALRLLRAAFERGLPEAVSLTLGGSHNLRHHAADNDEPVELGLTEGDVTWRIQLVPRGVTVDHVTEETLAVSGETVFARDSLGNCHYRGHRQQVSVAGAERLGLRWITELHPEENGVARMAKLVRDIHVFYDPDLRGLRTNGSLASADRHLHSQGRNVFTMLRKWRDKREDKARFAFVDEGMRAAFPGVYQELDFDASGQMVTGRFFRPGDEEPTPVNHEANGVLGMLVLLANVASADAGGIVAIDEPETALHPFAIASFVRDARARARQHQLTVVLTTHSPILLDQFNGEPERVFALERGRETLPVRLDQIRDRAWLAHYTLGELYAGGDFAANTRT